MGIERKLEIDGLAPIVGVAALFEPEWLIEIDATAVVD